MVLILFILVVRPRVVSPWAPAEAQNALASNQELVDAEWNLHFGQQVQHEL